MDSSQVIAELSDHILQDYYTAALNVIILQEYLVTFSSEVEVVWKRKLSTFTSILFLLNRYITLCNALLLLAIPNALPNDAICKLSVVVSLCTQVTSYVIWAAFSALRVFSLGNRNTALTAVTFGLGVVPFCVNMYLFIMELATVKFVEGNCVIHWLPSQILIDILEPVTRVSFILGDISVLYVTLSNAYSLRSKGSSQLSSSLFNVLVRDGIFYFVLLLLLDCIQLALWITNIFPEFSQLTTYISSIIISRFILDLRGVYLSSTRPSSLDTQCFERTREPTLHFTSIEAASLEMRQSGMSPGTPQATKGDKETTLPEELHGDKIIDNEVPGAERDDADDHRSQQVVC